MKFGKAEWFLTGYIPLYIIIVWIVGTYILTPLQPPGGGLDISPNAWIFLGLLVAIFFLSGISSYLFLKQIKSRNAYLTMMILSTILVVLLIVQLILLIYTTSPIWIFSLFLIVLIVILMMEWYTCQCYRKNRND